MCNKKRRKNEFHSVQSCLFRLDGDAAAGVCYLAERVSLSVDAFDILAGGDADHFLEHIGEMALIAKPCFDGRFR